MLEKKMATNHSGQIKTSGKIGMVIYPIDFKMHRDGKGANPREHSELCDRGERVQPTKRPLER
ncbi:hypothetical protein BB987_17055 [Photorhabdus temperata]|nr:hypothetical protein BB987_17055 [Photorhabdus temperata]